MHFVRYNEIRKVLTPLYGKGIVEKVKFLWREGWDKNPVPTMSVLFIPFMIIHGSWEYFFHDTSRYRRKYVNLPPIYRPDDPRVAQIQHYSGLD